MRQAVSHQSKVSKCASLRFGVGAKLRVLPRKSTVFGIAGALTDGPSIPDGSPVDSKAYRTSSSAQQPHAQLKLCVRPVGILAVQQPFAATAVDGDQLRGKAQPIFRPPGYRK